MTKYYIIGESGTDELWLIDIEKKSIEKFENVSESPVIETINTARKSGITVTKGISIAIVTHRRNGADVKMSINDPGAEKI
ncbi:hypothetical protein [Phyllobacterium sp. OV277]|uniref:hypothetical protein n=1 Tax=Phyllobacterium sp. OV277 TaxID=1882772 RepID=UPI00088C323A|nr:hypothetical protein [Phyllobacterium sp. OV277]SDP38700.1 hypothetical protein SAMN05443582_104413 [Phyllobacterium sp. OV277]